MRRILKLAIAPVALLGLLDAGCHSSADDGSTAWNQGSTWTKEQSQPAPAAQATATDKGTSPAPTAATLPSQ